MIHHVYNIRTDEMLFYSENYDECIKYIKRNKIPSILGYIGLLKNNIRSENSEI